MARLMQDIKLKVVRDGGGNAIGGDLAIVAGDFANVESTGQHQRQLLLNNKGDFKQNPSICVGLSNYIDDEGAQNIAQAIAKEFTKDGMQVNNLQPNVASAADSSVTIFENAWYI